MSNYTLELVLLSPIKCQEQNFKFASLLVHSNDLQANSAKKDPYIEEEESSNDDIKPKESRKKTSTKKAALKQEQEDEDDHGKISLNLLIHCNSRALDPAFSQTLP